MPLTVTRDDERRRFIAVGTGALSADEFRGFMAEHRVGDYRLYALVLDIREAALTVTAADIRGLAQRGDRLRSSEGPRGPVAIVAERLGVFGLARMYENARGIEESSAASGLQDDARSRRMARDLRRTRSTRKSESGSWRHGRLMRKLIRVHSGHFCGRMG
jgi:hypothetical protein